MKIVVTGTRGIPDIQGGIETHCQELYPRLANLGFDITLIRRSCFVKGKKTESEYKGVKLVNLFTLRIKTIETIIHTFLSVIWAKIHQADILHIHAIGPALFIPLAKLLGLKVVFTHHGPDYDRAKWGPFAKSVLKMGEKFGSKNADQVIVISEVIRKILEEKHSRYDTNLIFNGFSLPVFDNGTDYIESLGLTSRRYVFTLGRFVEEKGFDLLIKAFKKTNDANYQLVIAGDADHETSYSSKLKKMALSENVILTGFVRGKKLSQLFNHAALFVLPSYHEGLPISLLEAMSYNLPVLVSDIPANKQVNLPFERYFITGDEISLKTKLKNMLSTDYEDVEYDLSVYNWDVIAQQTADVYNKILKTTKS
ncbi:MAG TPA: glycosyltransferase family 4 protein [Bacteroidales bacterium]|jgi:glycosyltransferase involved in cell wall biosynthesis|nr:glycosyltransferase family 4 protein [Bacteroidales bacterium]